MILHINGCRCICLNVGAALVWRYYDSICAWYITDPILGNGSINAHLSLVSIALNLQRNILSLVRNHKILLIVLNYDLIKWVFYAIYSKPERTVRNKVMVGFGPTA